MSQRLRSRYESHRPESGEADLAETSVNELRSPTNAYVIPEEEEEEMLGDEDEEYDDDEAADEEEEDEEGEEEEEEESEGSGYGSETSSMIYDQNLDPDGWAKRLDELAGVMEMGEVEARALKWGPPIGKEREVTPLPLSDFKAVLNHHLQATEWKFASSSELFRPLPSRQPLDPISNMPHGLDAIHPIRVLGRDWVGREADSPRSRGAGPADDDVHMGRDPFGPTGLGIALDGGRM